RSLDRAQGGLGIGLALVQRLVEMHGGTVTASSALAPAAVRGSEFVVRLPLVAPPPPQPSLPPMEKAQPTRPSLRVLVVDDNVDTVTTLAMLVQESGHDVRTAFDGSAVLEAALDYRPNVVLLYFTRSIMAHFQMSGISQLAGSPTRLCVWLIARSGNGQCGHENQHSSYGADCSTHLS